MHRQYTRPLYQAAFIGLLALIASGPAYAVDGVIEINQARAKAGGVTPSDTPLFPVTLSQPGSYRLTGNLNVTDATARPAGTAAEDMTAIQVTTDNVTIDLNGFMISGPTVCSGSPLVCTPTGSGHGIEAANRTGTSVMNGTVRGMGSTGAQIGGQQDAALADRLRVQSNGGAGLLATTVTNCTAWMNRFVGIDAITATTCTSGRNGSAGIVADAVANSVAFSNEASGIAGTVAIGCRAFGNGLGEILTNGVDNHNECGSPSVSCP